MLEFPQIPAKVLLAALRERLRDGVPAQASSFAVGLFRRHQFHLVGGSLPRNPCNGAFFSPESCNPGAALVAGRCRMRAVLGGALRFVQVLSFCSFLIETLVFSST